MGERFGLKTGGVGTAFPRGPESIFWPTSAASTHLVELSRMLCRGVATGGISVFILPKSAQVNFMG